MSLGSCPRSVYTARSKGGAMGVTRHDGRRRLLPSLRVDVSESQDESGVADVPLDSVRTMKKLATLALALAVLPIGAEAQELDILRVDSLMAVATDRVQSAAIAAARADSDAIGDGWVELFGYGGLFAEEVLGALATAGCDTPDLRAGLFWLSNTLSLAEERSRAGEMDQWPQGPEFILDLLEDVRETWAGIKDDPDLYCGSRR